MVDVACIFRGSLISAAIWSSMLRKILALGFLEFEGRFGDHRGNHIWGRGRGKFLHNLYLHAYGFGWSLQTLIRGRWLI